MADELEEKLARALGGQCEGRIAGKISEFGHLLTRRAAVRLLCREGGIDTERRILLSHASAETLPFSFSARIDRIYPVQTFASGEKCVRLHLSDKSGGATLVLWNAQAGLVQGALSIGDEIECRGAYFRGGEIHLGREGAIAAGKKSPVASIGSLASGACNVEGFVKEVEPDYHYVDRKSGEKRSMSSFQLCEQGGKQCRRVVVWSQPDGTQKAEEGDSVLLENVLFRNGELHFNSFSRMVKKASAAEKSGRLESVAVEGDVAVFAIGKSRFSVPMNDALLLLGIPRIPEGVKPETLLSIRAQSAAGKKASYKEENGKLSWLQLKE